MKEPRDKDIHLWMNADGAKIVFDALCLLRLARVSASQSIDGLLVTLRKQLYGATRESIYRDRP